MSGILTGAIELEIESCMAEGRDREGAERALALWILLRRGSAEAIEEELQYLLERKKADWAGAGPVLVDLATVTPEVLSWVCDGWIPRGKLTLLSGDPKLGKSLLTLLLAAAVSTGSPFPNPHGSMTVHGSVIVLSAEDDIADTIVPRLISFGADLKKVKVLKSVRVPKGETDTFEERMLGLREDLKYIEMAIRDLGDVVLIVIDPILAYMGTTEIYNAADVRAVLTPLARLAARHKIAVLAVNHLNKNAGGPAIYRSSGSLAFTAVARMILTVAKDPKNPKRRVLLRDGNLGPAGQGGLAYTVESNEAGQPTLCFEDKPVEMTADEALSQAGSDHRDGELERAEDWLRERLAFVPVEANEIFEESAQAGIAKRTLDRAKKELKVRSRPRGRGKERKWYWELPTEGGPTKNAKEGGDGEDGDLGNVGNLDDDPQGERETGVQEDESEDCQGRQGCQHRQSGEAGNLGDEGDGDRHGQPGADPSTGDVEAPLGHSDSPGSQDEIQEEAPDSYHDEEAGSDRRG